MHHVQGCTLEVGNVSVTPEAASGVEVGIYDLATVAASEARHPFFLLTFQLLYDLSAPLSSPSGQDFNRAESWCLHSAPLPFSPL